MFGGPLDSMLGRHRKKKHTIRASRWTQSNPNPFYDLTVNDAKGNEVNLGDFKGKVLLIVNVASECGLADSNYKELNELYDLFKKKGLEILAFPCNQFGEKEPGSNEQIQEFVSTRFKAEFPVFGKVDVNGDTAAPIYKHLKSTQPGLREGGIEWNFTKFLVDTNGDVIHCYPPMISPMSIVSDLLMLLPALDA